MLSDLFPDAPSWLIVGTAIVWTALTLFILACFVANPVEAWRARYAKAEAEQHVHDLKRFQRIQDDLINPPLKEGVTQELRRVGADV
jgi:hypothetical protein